jgi:hypothetical protein
MIEFFTGAGKILIDGFTHKVFLNFYILDITVIKLLKTDHQNASKSGRFGLSY